MTLASVRGSAVSLARVIANDDVGAISQEILSRDTIARDIGATLVNDSVRPVGDIVLVLGDVVDVVLW